MTYTHEAPTAEELAELTKPAPAPLYSGSRKTKAYRGNGDKLAFLLEEAGNAAILHDQIKIDDWVDGINAIEQAMQSHPNLVTRTHAGYTNRDLAALISVAVAGLEKYRTAFNAIKEIIDRQPAPPRQHDEPSDEPSYAQQALDTITENGWTEAQSRGVDIQELDNVWFEKSREYDDRIVFEDGSTIVFAGGQWQVGSDLDHHGRV